MEEVGGVSSIQIGSILYLVHVMTRLHPIYSTVPNSSTKKTQRYHVNRSSPFISQDSREQQQTFVQRSIAGGHLVLLDLLAG